MARRIFQILRGTKVRLPKLANGEFGLCTDENLYIGTPSGNKKIAYYDDIEGFIVQTIGGEY